MNNIKLGLIPSPDLPADITSQFIDELPEFLRRTVNDTIEWKTQIVIDPLVGTAEHIKQVIDKSIQLKEKNDWDYVICLTDLPYFSDKHVVVADLNVEHNVAFVSIPAFGTFPMKRRIKNIIADILNDLEKSNINNIIEQDYVNTVSTSIRRKATYSELEHANNESNEDDKDNFTQEDTEDKSHVKYVINSKWLGHMRILAGMTFANRPWSALISFKKIIMLAFGTGVYITLFPTPWELSTIYSLPRFVILMIFAILGMVTWLIFAHQLWEKPTHRGDVRLRKLYNYTTVSTLLTISIFNYIVLYSLFLLAISIFVPAELFEAVTDLEDDASLVYYFQLTWLITSLGTLAGSIGATSEDENKIRQITYSYRQINRSYEIENEKADDEQESGYEYG